MKTITIHRHGNPCHLVAASAGDAPARFYRVALKTPWWVAAGVFILALGPAIADDGWSLKPSDKALQVSGEMPDPLNVSGLASVANGRLVIVGDELRHGLQTGRLDLEHGRIVVDQGEFVLLKGNKKELDLEDVSADPRHHCYYACGSCGVSRKTGEPAPNRQWLFRIETDPTTGAPLPAKVTRASLAAALRADAFLAKYLDRDADDMGIDVEGLAFKDGRLWVGLRSPNVDGRGIVEAASADDLMAGKPVVFERFELRLGPNLGIRSIEPIKDGFLLICGPTGSKPSKKLPFSLCFWAGSGERVLRVGELPRPPVSPGGTDTGGKPEGLLVVSETSEKLGLIVVSDSADNGAPTLYEVTRPPHP